MSTLVEIAMSASLTLQNDRHNKSYTLSLEAVEDGWVVNFSYGAIGAIQKPGTKTKSPVPYDKALKVYQKLQREKTMEPCDCCGDVYSGTFSTGLSTVPPVSPLKIEMEHPGFNPELLEAIDDVDVDRFLTDDRYGVERKYDGERLSVSYVKGETVGYNRLGKIIPVPASLLKKIEFLMDWRTEATLQLDGEWIRDEYVAFDLLALGGDLKAHPMETRHKMLTELLATTGIKVADLVTGKEMKAALLVWETAHRGEGVVFKKLSAPYMPGRRGVNVKLKFWASATVRVTRKMKNLDAHSFGVEAYTPGSPLGEWGFVGNVTCKGPLPEIGTYREVMYLYVGKGGHLYQTEDLGPRTDVVDADCLYSTLKQKQDVGKLTA